MAVGACEDVELAVGGKTRQTSEEPVAYELLAPNASRKSCR